MFKTLNIENVKVIDLDLIKVSEYFFQKDTLLEIDIDSDQENKENASNKSIELLNKKHERTNEFEDEKDEKKFNVNFNIKGQPSKLLNNNINNDTNAKQSTQNIKKKEGNQNKNNSKNGKLNNKLEDKEDNKENIFEQKFYNEELSKFINGNIYEKIPRKTEILFNTINQKKVGLKEFDNKIQEFHTKLKLYKENKRSYERIKVLVGESQIKLGSFYDMTNTEMKSIRELIKNNKYSRHQYNTHKENISFYRQNYLRTIETTKNLINNLKQYETDIKIAKKDVKENVLSFSNDILENLNIKVNDFLSNNDNEIIEYKDINPDEIEKEFIKEIDLLTSDLNKIEDNRIKKTLESNEEDSTDDIDLKDKKNDEIKEVELVIDLNDDEPKKAVGKGKGKRKKFNDVLKEMLNNLK